MELPDVHQAVLGTGIISATLCLFHPLPLDWTSPCFRYDDIHIEDSLSECTLREPHASHKSSPTPSYTL